MDNRLTSLDKLCSICGDKASAYNFGGLSCDSCKIFFRRNGPIIKKFECDFSENCAITKSTRKYCPKCRLIKCFAVGMRLRWMNERHSKIIESQINCTIDSPLIATVQKNNDNLLRDLLKLNDSNVNESSIFEYAQYLNANKPFVQLTSPEWTCINEIRDAMKIFTDESTLPMKGCAKNLSNGYSYFGLYATNIIKFCKQFPAYRSLNIYDQINILKPFFMEICAIRFAFQVANRRDGIVMIGNETGDQTILFANELYPRVNSVFQCGHSVKLLNQEMDKDDIIRNLLIAQSLFSPRENMVNFESIRYQYHSYHYLLKRYLCHKYGNSMKADKKYHLLMNYIEQYYQHMKNHFTRMFSQYVDFDQVGQVMTELFGPKFSLI